MSKKTGRCTYVKRGLVGICAATLLAGLCATPAFADATIDASGSVDMTAGTASTSVSMEAATGNISATVPTAVTAVVKPDGSLTFPDTTKFKISVATGNWPLKVSSLVVAPEASYTLAASDTFADQGNLFLKLGSTALVGDSDTNSAALTGFSQVTSQAQDFPIEMTGKVKDPKFSNSTAKIFTLNWTIAPVTAA